MYASQMDHYFDALRLNLNGPFSRGTGHGGATTAARAGGEIGRGAPLPSPVGLSQFYSPEAKMGAFAYAFGFQADQDSVFAPGGLLRNGFSLRATGGMAGVDRRINDNLAVGLAIGGGGASGDLSQGRGRFQANTFQVGPYASYNRGRLYVDASATYTDFDFDSQRVVAFPGFAEFDGAHHGAHSWSMYSSSGYLWRNEDRWLYGPTASLQYTRLNLDAFTEAGGPAALTVSEDNQDSLRSTLGFRVARECPTEGGGMIIPEFRLRWAHEFHDPGSITASFAAATGTPFTTNLVGPDRDSALVGASVTALLKKDLSFYGTYDADLGRSGGNVNAWRGGLALKF
jgi:outer membrane autotransporter protein